ncbi:DUF1178 family protein [Novosphingobium terrae]|uniref:DUF1178 family protein n=1 Tax=Novosphingobium terrae TaxID=2726189 RepID=UPI00198263C7|nr:DUF1178 family protein [Novosphingobium terrae]
MIVYDLQCEEGGHKFEGWFGSSGDFDGQQARGLIACPDCGSARVSKALMAPNLGRKGNQKAVELEPAKVSAAPAPAPTPPALPPEARAMLQAVAALQAEAIKSSRWVGDGFAKDARAMHYGEKENAPIHGRASAQDVQEMLEEGIGIAPLLIPVAPPEEIN